jgi:ubiquinone/menaquinone biosynthesis C-methylase UbiE
LLIVAKRILQRLFSIPGLRWRGRVKQFEQDVYDQWADAIDRAVWAPWCNHWVESFAKEIPEGSAILDIGCGTGSALLILAQRRPALLAGMDISPRAIAVASAKLAGLGAELRAGDAEAQLPWGDATFDVVTMTATIHHFPSPEKVLAHVRRVLRPAGRLIIAEPFFFFPILQIDNLLLKVYPLNGDLHFLSQRGLRRLVERCGFQAVAQRRAAFFARYTVARKLDTERGMCLADRCG